MNQINGSLHRNKWILGNASNSWILRVPQQPRKITAVIIVEVWYICKTQQSHNAYTTNICTNSTRPKTSQEQTCLDVNMPPTCILLGPWLARPTCKTGLCIQYCKQHAIVIGHKIKLWFISQALVWVPCYSCTLTLTRSRERASDTGII